ncbi:DUF6371 domain-containing protein [Halpernia frigidisoli]|uniref:Uncharacterized protein n=1 Tax=Halpernia frigidisoli TaxID=1125876 RepID=A0A1I3J4M4_9FLAO|nr:DUF6371 domain-containing protein [Halpernia frigidisoli]SFI55207.1 hypothetical protein SAMN05443292_2932 [Halpernia frigidisoli]
MNKYRYILDPSSKKYKCPNCNKFSLVVFIDTERSEIMENYGRCDRESKCGFFHHPSKDGFKNRINSEISNDAFVEIFPSFHKNHLVDLSIIGDNNFLKYLRFLFGTTIANSVQKKYKIGTLCEFNFGTVFWQIDERKIVRAGKVIQYFETGKRTKNITWMHQFLKIKKEISDYNLCQCLFGLHLIKDDKKSIIALVESEKTACIMSVIFPDFLWLACGAKGEFKLKKLEPIKHRKIIAYSDSETQKNGSTTYEEWKRKAEGFNAVGFQITVSDLLEKETTDEQKAKGIDIADFFMREFLKSK